MKKSSTFANAVGALMLMLWGGILIYFYLSGRLSSYVSAAGWFRPMVMAGGIGCALVGLFNLVTMGVKDPADEQETAAPESMEGNGMVGWLVMIAVLVAPITYATMYSPDGVKNVSTLANEGTYTETYQKDSMANKFDVKTKSATATGAKSTAAAPTPTVASSSSTASPAPSNPAVANNPPAAPAANTTAANSPPATKSSTSSGSSTPGAAAQSKSYGTFTLADLKSQVQQSPEGNFMLEVPEIYYTAGDKEVQSVLTGQPIETVAQIIPEKVHNEKGNRVRIFRMLIQCCAADARPYSIPVEFVGVPPKIKDMTWVKVTGKMNFEKQGDQTIPVIAATGMKEVPEPENKMVY